MPRKFRCKSQKTSTITRYVTFAVATRRNKILIVSHRSSFSAHIFQGMERWQVTAWYKLLPLATYGEQTDGQNGRTCVDSSSMSHGFCHISIDVESSMYSPRPLLVVTPFVQPRLRIALFSLTRRVPLDLHSRWPRSSRERRIRKQKKSVSPDGIDSRWWCSL